MAGFVLKAPATAEEVDVNFIISKCSLLNALVKSVFA